MYRQWIFAMALVTLAPTAIASNLTNEIAQAETVTRLAGDECNAHIILSGNCDFNCDAGGDIVANVFGVVSGSANCGGGVASCNSLYLCSAKDDSPASDTGDCGGAGIGEVYCSSSDATIYLVASCAELDEEKCQLMQATKVYL